MPYSDDVLRLNPQLAAEPAPRAPRAHPEQDMQIALIDWRDTLLGQYPLLDQLVHWPNGEKRDKATAALLAKMGVRRGLPDLWLFVPRYVPAHNVSYSGLIIELKAPGEDLSPDQERWKPILEACGFLWVTIAGEWTAAAAAIAAWCGMPEGTVPQ